MDGKMRWRKSEDKLSKYLRKIDRYDGGIDRFLSVSNTHMQIMSGPPTPNPIPIPTILTPIAGGDMEGTGVKNE